MGVASTIPLRELGVFLCKEERGILTMKLKRGEAHVHMQHGIEHARGLEAKLPCCTRGRTRLVDTHMALKRCTSAQNEVNYC